LALEKRVINLFIQLEAAVAYAFGPNWRNNGPVWFEMGHTCNIKDKKPQNQWLKKNIERALFPPIFFFPHHLLSLPAYTNTLNQPFH
jgi:hypothetical protein